MQKVTLSCLNDKHSRSVESPNSSAYKQDVWEAEERRFSVEVSGGQTQVYSHGFSHTEVAFDYCSLNYIISGEGRLHQSQGTSDLLPGSLFAVRSENVFKVQNTGSCGLDHCQIRFRGEQADALIDRVFSGDSGPLNYSGKSWVKETFQRLMECMEVPTRGSKQASEILLEYLFARLQAALRPKLEENTAAFVAYEKCRKYVQSNFRSITGAQEIAQHCNISHQYLCQLFNRFSEETPTQMLLRYRLEFSVDLLRQGQSLIKHIAHEVGFEDPYYFSKRFKEFYGMSPRNYMRDVRQVS